MGFPRIGAFIDIGHSKSTVTIARFESKLLAQILVSNSEKNLGGRDLDWLISKKFAQEFQDEN